VLQLGADVLVKQNSDDFISAKCHSYKTFFSVTDDAEK